MKTFTYKTVPTNAQHMVDAIRYTDEHPLEVVKLEAPDGIKYTMRGEPEKNGNHHYIASSEEDLAEYYANHD